jgi:hypothetical protein
LPHHELGLDVIALIGQLRYAEHRSVPEILTCLQGRGLAVAERTVTNLLDRYDELLAVALSDDRRLQRLLAAQGQVILALDGLQPEVGHEGLWVIRDCISGEILLAKSLLSARSQELAQLLTQVHEACPAPVVAVVSDGQHSIRKAVRKIERAVEGRSDPEAEVVRGYCSAVRSALTDDGRPPLDASGLQLHQRLQAIADSLDRVQEKRGYPAS